MNSFSYRGPIPASKSMMNRALLVQSYFPDLRISGDSQCDDVIHMKSALQDLRQNCDLNCGEAGAVIRMMALRASRERGRFRLTGSPRLLRRPHADLVRILQQLGVSCELQADAMIVVSEGWKRPGSRIQVDRQISSQFVTALVLNSWNLEFDLEFEMKSGVSEGYWQMTLQMARSLGMQIRQNGDVWTIPAGQKIRIHELTMEPDYSSAFAIAAAAALAGHAEITNATAESLQPDFVFTKFLQEMGVPIRMSGGTLEIRQAPWLNPLNLSLESAPDLFPVLSVLCAFAGGESLLKEAPHLVHKESDRIRKTAELLRSAGAQVQIRPDGMAIAGGPMPPKAFEFDPDQDHRMAMAAGLLKLKGFPIQIRNPEVVKKSFPEFWQILGVQP